MAELADALDLGSSGRPWGFKSLHPQWECFKALRQGFGAFFRMWKNFLDYVTCSYTLCSKELALCRSMVQRATCEQKLDYPVSLVTVMLMVTKY